MLKKIIPVEDAISVLHDGDVLATSGYGGHGIPEQLLVALEQRFLETGRPEGLTLIHATVKATPGIKASTCSLTKNCCNV